jgi:acyl carrier protein
MEKSKFLQSFQEQFEETPITEIQLDTVFKSLSEWSSMMALLIIAFIDEEYEVSVNGDDINNASTIEDLFIIVESKLK